MSKHTPGPWVKDYGYTLGHIKAISPRQGTWTPTVARYDIGAPDYPAIKDPEEREANARLIAAAPELYEALKRIAADSEDTALASVRHLGNIARAAIAKVEP
jgi:hypothetical protein